MYYSMIYSCYHHTCPSAFLVLLMFIHPKKPFLKIYVDKNVSENGNINFLETYFSHQENIYRYIDYKYIDIDIEYYYTCFFYKFIT